MQNLGVALPLGEADIEGRFAPPVADGGDGVGAPAGQAVFSGLHELTRIEGSRQKVSDEWDCLQVSPTGSVCRGHKSVIKGKLFFSAKAIFSR